MFFFLGIITLQAQVINFPDANFKAALLASSPSNHIAQDFGFSYIKIDANDNGEIEVDEAKTIRDLNVGYSTNNYVITSLEGISYFSNLIGLHCELKNLTTLDVNDCHNLQLLGVYGNQLTALYFNETHMFSVNCANNNLTSLDVSGLTGMRYLECYNNQLTSLDVSSLVSLDGFWCHNNNLTSLSIKNNRIESTLQIFPNPNLSSICADESQVPQVQNIALQNNPNCAVSSTCELSLPDITEDKRIVVYPNPVTNSFNIDLIKEFQVSSIQIYNTLGQLVLTIPNAQQTKTVDVSSLKTGNYVVKINSEKGSSSAKFVKI